MLSVNTAPVAIGTRIPERALADQLLEGYFSNFEGLFRVIHLPTFRAAYERYWQQRDSAADVFLLQLQVCMSLGVTAHQDSLRWRNAASQWLLEAQTWLHGSSGKAKKKPTFEELQLACLVLIAEANTSGTDHLSQCWVDAGNLVRKAICAGLHRDPKYLGNITIQQAEMRRRLWVTILELNLLLSLQSGRPPLISPSDYDTCPPASLNDEDLDKDLGSTSSPGVDREKPTETAIQLAYFDSFNLRLEIVCKLSDFGKDMSYDQLLRLHSELSKSQRAMRQRFALFSSVQTGDASPRYTSSQTSLSEILLSRYFLALHMPVLGSSIKNPAFHFSRRFCLATSIQVVEASGILSNTRHNDGANNRTLGSTLASLFVNSPGIFRHIASQAVFAIALELITFREEECDNHGAFPVEDATELLQYLKSAQEWAAERIRAGLTDVRSYCFIAACISYAASLEAGGEALDVEREIVDAAVRGHERCLELLNGIAEALGAFTNESDNSSRVNTPAGSLAVTDMSFDWVGNFMEENLDGFAFDWTYPIDTGTESMNLGLMAL